MTNDFRKLIYEWKYDPEVNPRKDFCIIYQLQKFFATL
jgi:hypothetical protein